MWRVVVGLFAFGVVACCFVLVVVGCGCVGMFVYHGCLLLVFRCDMMCCVVV